MTTFVVDGVFNNGNTLTGTVDLNGISLLNSRHETTVDLIISGVPSHFTHITADYLDLIPSTNINGNYALISAWLLGARNDEGDNVGFYIRPFNYLYPAPWDYTLTQGTFTNSSLTGTICPMEGCAPFFYAPGPVLGAGLPGIVLLATLLLTQIRRLWRV